MKKYFIVAIAAIIIVLGVIFTIKDLFVPKKGSQLIDFQLYGSYAVDTSGIRQWFHVAEDTPFTFFEQIRWIDEMQDYYAREFNLTVPDIDLADKDKYLVVSIGREVLEMQYEYEYQYVTNITELKLAKATITFSDTYNDGMMYIYTMDQVEFPSALTEKNAFYVMKESGKEYLGETVFDLNTRYSNGAPNT